MKRNIITAVFVVTISVIMIASMVFLSACRKQKPSESNTSIPAVDNVTPAPTAEITDEPDVTNAIDTAAPADSDDPIDTEDPDVVLTEDPETTGDSAQLIEDNGDIVITIPTGQGSGGL